MSNKTAKDIAFDKERQKLKKQIRDKQEEILSLKEKLHEAETTIREQSEWIERLLDYTELTKEDIEKLKKNGEALNMMTSIFKRVGFY